MILVIRQKRAIAVNCVYHLNIGTNARLNGKEPTRLGAAIPG